MRRSVYLLLAFASLLLAACGRTPVGEPEDPEVLELRAKTPIPLMSLAGTTWVMGDCLHTVKLDERGIIIPGETAPVLDSPAYPWGPYYSAWSFDDATTTAYVCFRFPEAGKPTKEMWFKKPATANYTVDKENKTVTAPAFGLGQNPMDIYIFNPEEIVLLSARSERYCALSLRPASSREQTDLAAAPAPGEAGFDELAEAVLVAVEQSGRDQGFSESEAVQLKEEFAKVFKSTFGE